MSYCPISPAPDDRCCSVSPGPEWPGGIVITTPSCLRQFVTLTRETLSLGTGECRAVPSFICRDQNKINQLSLIVHFQPLDTMPLLASTASPSKSLQTYDLI